MWEKEKMHHSCDSDICFSLISASQRDGLYMLDFFLHLGQYQLWWLILSRIRNYHHILLRNNTVKLVKHCQLNLPCLEIVPILRWTFIFFWHITHLHMLYYVGVSIFSTLSFMLFIQVDYVGNVKDAEKIIQRIINEYRFFLLFIVLDIANLSNIDIQTLFSFTVCTLAS